MHSDFDKWLGETLETPPEPDMRQEIHLAILKERLRQARRRRRRLAVRWSAVLVPLVVAAALVVGVVPLGGDDFALETVEGELTGGDVVRSPFRGGGFNVPEDFTEDDIHEADQQIAAGEGEVVGLKGLSALGRTRWSVERRREIHGKTTLWGSQPVGRDVRMPREFGTFLVEEFPAWEARIEAGEIPVARTTEETFDGVRFAVRHWIFQSESVGEVTYSEGEPIR